MLDPDLDEIVFPIVYVDGCDDVNGSELTVASVAGWEPDADCDYSEVDAVEI